MSRSGYSDDCDGWALIRWRGAVKQAIRGQRGQAMLRELVQALDALPEKTLASGSLVTADGEYCALGALGRARGIDLENVDPEDRSAVAQAFGVAEALAAEVMWANDSGVMDEQRAINFEVCGPMRKWESHTQLRWVTNPNAGRIRWEQMRAWAAGERRHERMNAMSERAFEFQHQGRTVRPGQVLHVAPALWWRAGPCGKVERYYGDTVTLRSDNGAVPTVPIDCLSWEPHPETVAMEELRAAGFARPTWRDVRVWMAARHKTPNVRANRGAVGDSG